MDIYLDTANIEEIKSAFDTGLVRGVTTNPSIIAREGKSLRDTIREIDEITGGATINVEVTAADQESMIAEALVLIKLGRSIVIKVPPTLQGLAAAGALRERDVRTTVTLIMSPMQAVMASIAGAYFVAPFLGRLTDAGHSGIELIRDIRSVFDRHGVDTKMIAASVRDPRTASQAFEAGSDVVTLPGKVFAQLIKHPLTDQGLAKFEEDLKKIPQ